MSAGRPPREGAEDREIQPILETVSDILALEISKTMDFYRATAEEGDAAVQKILVSGGGSSLLGGIAEHLREHRARVSARLVELGSDVRPETFVFAGVKSPDHSEPYSPHAVSSRTAPRGSLTVVRKSSNRSVPSGCRRCRG